MALSKIDTEMDQEKYLREVTRHFRGIEKPLKYGPVIETLNDLIAALHQEFATNYVNIEMVNHIMLSYKSNPKEWKKFAKFDRYKYTRNLVDAGNGKFNLMILCWGEGHGSTIHDHSDSHCFMKMLKGELTETRYTWPENTTAEDHLDAIPEDGEFEYHDALQVIGQRTMGLNDVAYINDNLGLHRVENPSHSDTAVSLHLYCPPFDTCSMFEKTTGKRLKCNITFWSKYGQKVEH
ncbi:cysteine dioxygenase type 1 [Musca vetustissima]|uniref:cysteine dioxygenase type 1 n=1 Tax=Musca vetustissima TaxID=27455 RepID=UPI002AB6641D|nr:cysteine dioxygenase type 1 [Musca vetustissima]